MEKIQFGLCEFSCNLESLGGQEATNDDARSSE